MVFTIPHKTGTQLCCSSRTTTKQREKVNGTRAREREARNSLWYFFSPLFSFCLACLGRNMFWHLQQGVARERACVRTCVHWGGVIAFYFCRLFEASTPPSPPATSVLWSITPVCLPVRLPPYPGCLDRASLGCTLVLNTRVYIAELSSLSSFAKFGSTVLNAFSQKCSAQISPFLCSYSFKRECLNRRHVALGVFTLGAILHNNWF